jgi:hypothetical protein
LASSAAVGVTVVSSDRRMRPRFAISSNCSRVGGCAMFVDCRFSHLLDTILSRSLSPSTARTSRIVDGAHTQGKGEPSPGERTARSASSANLKPSLKSAAPGPTVPITGEGRGPHGVMHHGGADSSTSSFSYGETSSYGRTHRLPLNGAPCAAEERGWSP